MARILAIDYGKKRTGIAVTDEMQLIASGLPNGAKSVDHIVVKSDDWQQSVEALRKVGLEPLRQSDKVRPGVMQVI